MLVEDIIKFRNKVDGDVGLELEFEGKNLPVVEDEFWKSTNDGSLRGGIEYVLRSPVKLEHLDKSLEYLFRKLDVTKIRETYRAGIHTHINIRKLTPIQVINFFVLYSIFEEVILSLCNESRRNNLFCLSNTVANGYVDEIIGIVKSGKVANFNTDVIRYSSMNLKPVPVYGSVEFRALESTTDVNKILFWSTVLVQLRDKAKEFDTPLQIMEMVSAGNIIDFTRSIFQKGLYTKLFKAEDWNYQIRTGIINVQDLCYAHAWGERSKYIFDKTKGEF